MENYQAVIFNVMADTYGFSSPPVGNLGLTGVMMVITDWGISAMRNVKEIKGINTD